MIRTYPKSELGQADYGWLKARYHFSFARYVDRKKMGFPPLRVWNDDRIQPLSGFPFHAHRDMEIITYLIAGAITHEDNMGNRGRIKAGEIQVMSAGSGIMHSEYNREKSVTRLFQIWIAPRRTDIAPRWETKPLPEHHGRSEILLLVSGREMHTAEDAISLNQDAALYALRLAPEQSLSVPITPDRQGYGVVSQGIFSLGGFTLREGDGLYLFGETDIVLQGQSKFNEMIFADLPRE